jgi:hypothetical protein
MATAPVRPAVSAPELVPVPGVHTKLNKGPGKLGVLIFGVVLIIGVVYAGSHLIADLGAVHSSSIFLPAAWTRPPGRARL